MFNQNLRYFCEKERLSQQRFADMMDVKRGKVAGYFYNTTPKKEFQRRFASKFGIDLDRFNSVEMDEENYKSFFSETSTTKIVENVVSEPKANYLRRSDAVAMLMSIKKKLPESDRQNVDNIIVTFSQLLEENGFLKGEISQLHKDMLEIAKKV